MQKKKEVLMHTIRSTVRPIHAEYFETANYCFEYKPKKVQRFDAQGKARDEKGDYKRKQIQVKLNAPRHAHHKSSRRVLFKNMSTLDKR
jgi:hypothetical protein